MDLGGYPYIAGAGTVPRNIGALNSTKAQDSAPSASPSAADPKLLKTCLDFESVFLTMIWKEMQKSAGVDLGAWGAFAEQAVGENWAKSGGIGLAKVIYRSMSKHLSN